MALVAAALTLSACASGTRTDASGPTEPVDGPPNAPAGHAAPPGEATGTNPLPPVDTVDVRTGMNVNLGSLLPDSTPLLVWFWAPH